MCSNMKTLYIYTRDTNVQARKNQILVKEKKKNVCQREDSNGGEPGETYMQTNRSEHETG